jgi:D-alanyl-D-alanine carboxypeptidase (penicillin-binding protein 5/6)
MASITKLMTALVVLDRVHLDDVVTVTGGAAALGESTANLVPGERLTVRELLQAALIQSANDAATALAVHVAGSESAFVALMNEKAKALGLRDTHFVNPHGLDAPGHYSSARDLTILAELAMRKPIVREIVRMESGTISGGRVLESWNDLLSTFPGVIGVKTGHTSGAGWSQAAAARGPGFVVYATLLGEPTRDARNSDLARLLSWAISQYQRLPLVERGRRYASVELPYGKGPLPVVARRTVEKPVRIGHALVEEVVSQRFVSLPVEKGRRLGSVRVYREGRMIASVPLVAARSVSEPGFLSRVGWYAGETAETVWGWLTP